MAYPIASMADGGTLYSDGTVKYEASMMPGATSYGYPAVSTGSAEGQVLGTSTGGGTSPTGSSPTNGGGSGSPSGPSAEELARQQYEAQVRSEIEGGYSSYEAELDKMLNEGLPGQQTALTTQASAQFTRGLEDLAAQKQEGLTGLATEEAKSEKSKVRTLKDISANLRNAFMAGNVFLGARGAGDSSAANMYSYALTKLGSKQRGDVLSQFNDILAEVGQRKSRVGEIYNTEKNKLQALYDEKIGQISQWFYEQQNALRSQKGQLAVSKGQDLATLSQNLLNQAIAEINFIKEQAAAKQQMLDQWALNNSTTLDQALSNLRGVSNYQAGTFKAQPIVGQPQMGAGGNIFANAAYIPGSAYTTEEEKNNTFGGGTSGGYGATGLW